MRAPLAAIDEPVVGALLQYWTELRGFDEAMPLRKQIDPVQLGPLLAHIALLDVLPEAPFLRCRLAGDEVEQRFGRSLRGATLADLSLGKEAYEIERQYLDCIAGREPVYCAHRFLDPTGRPYNYHRIALPLADEAGAVSHLLLGFRFIPWPAGGTGA